jgi:ABC-type Fe3+ transport system substrate-binding protein
MHNPMMRRWLTSLLMLTALPMSAEQRVIVISPHNEAIRYEFARGFARWHQQHFGEPATVEWRDLGGSTDALRFVLSEFARKPDGIGIDCFFGGGEEPVLQLADKHCLQAHQLPEAILAGLSRYCGGVELYDAQGTWFGAAFSSFGILQNTRVQRLIGLPLATRWEQLADPTLYGWLGAGDPRNSGTMNTMYESVLQAFGWQKGWQWLTAMAGNVRKFDRLAATTAKDVTLGETAYALAVDFYAFAQITAGDKTNLTFVLPRDFTALTTDGIALLQGAPHRITAGRFIDFVLSEDGQRLWFLPVGHPEGPQKYSIERMTIRPGFYQRYRGISNIENSPFDLQPRFRYDSQLARTRRDVVSALIGALLVDSHAELKATWHALIQRDGVAEKLPALGAPPISEAEAMELALGPWANPALRNQKKIDWQIWARDKYRRFK